MVIINCSNLIIYLSTYVDMLIVVFIYLFIHLSMHSSILNIYICDYKLFKIVYIVYLFTRFYEIL